MGDATGGIAASEKQAASLDTDTVAVADADAEAMTIARTDKAFPIQNYHGCNQRLLLRPEEDLLTLPRQHNASTR